MNDKLTLADRLRKVGYEFLPDREPTEFLPSDERDIVDEAAACIEELEAAIRKHREAGIESNCGVMSCEKGCGNDARLWAVLEAVDE